jgi:hypothetical protein
MITTFPTLSFGLRTTIHTLCFPNVTPTIVHRWAEASGLVVAVYVCAVAADDLCFVFQVVGSTCGSLLMFILPAAVYLGGPAAASDRSDRGFLGFTGAPRVSATQDTGSTAVALAWAVLGVGAIIFFGSTAASVLGPVPN